MSSALFVDFKKAFDLVSWEVKLLKIEASGIRGIAQNWLRSLLTGYFQRVKVNAELSNVFRVRSGLT